MKSKNKIAIIIGLCLAGAGLLLTLIALAAGATIEKAVYDIDKNIGKNGRAAAVYEKWDDYDKGEYYMEEKDLILRGETYSAESVRRLKLDIAAAEAQLVIGDRFSVQSANIPCAVDFSDGTLNIRTKHPRWNWLFKAPWKNPKIVVTVPPHAKLDSVSIEIGAGSLVSKNAEISCNSAKIEVGMGECILYNFTAAEYADIECGMGSMEIRGTITGSAKVDCGMGEINLYLYGDPQDYSYTASVGMGSVRVNTTELNGMGGKAQSPYRGKNDLEIDCGMGSINVQIAR
ncbi:DUF4097 family beta strand repeat-containing protein [Treponema brennaborense]|uniref:Adhesin domain-containing protein n=1 Tax=Treponema brennaborense (strain DSM 12168 / CIP 105900 / DD5/3) TaxID=906968 RepID=F4LJT3_TREBD|nr:DUF4097 family beta strand repeat-containing protein [Treponema brennaborense]AEE17463.1 hypothetical protein Trebr_2048 [Treponema brennaborense DSM 12168]